MRACRPHLLAIDQPGFVLPNGTGAQGGEIGSGAGLGKQLTPDLLTAQRRPCEALLCRGAGESHQRGDTHAKPDAEEPRWNVVACFFFGENHLLNCRTAGTAPFARPADARIAGGRLARLPAACNRQPLRLGGSSGHHVSRCIDRQPLPYCGSVNAILGRVVKIHAPTSTTDDAGPLESAATNCSPQTAGAPATRLNCRARRKNRWGSASQVNPAPP